MGNGFDPDADAIDAYEVAKVAVGAAEWEMERPMGTDAKPTRFGGASTVMQHRPSWCGGQPSAGGVDGVSSEAELVAVGCRSRST